MAETTNQKNIDAGIANLASVIKSITKSKKNIISASKDLAEIIKIMAAVSKALGSTETKEAITVSNDISKVLKGISKSIASMAEPFEQINSVNFGGLLVAKTKVKLMSNTIKSIINEINSQFKLILSNRDVIDTINDTAAMMAAITDAITAIALIFAALDTVETKDVKNNIKKITHAINYLKPLIESLQELENTKDIKGVADIAKELEVAMGSINAIFILIRKSKTFGVKFKSKLIIKALGRIKDIVDKIQETFQGIKDAKNIKKQVTQVKEIFDAMKSIMIAAMLMVPVSVMFVALSPIIILCLVAAALVLKLLIFILVYLLNPMKLMKAKLVILGMIVLMLLIVTLALELLLLGMLAIPAIKTFPYVLAFFLGLIALVVMLAAFGLIVSVAWQLMVIGIIGVALITVAVLCVVVIALLLRVLQELDLDIEKIKENVKKVLETASQIILWVVEPLDPQDKMHNDSDERPEPGIFDIIGHGLVKAIGAIFAAISLMAILIAVAAILLIAMLLRSLQTLDLDVGKIRDNVMLVLDTCEWILEYITTPSEGRFEESDKADTVTVLAGVVYKPLIKVIDAIAGAAYLLVMLIGILAIMLIALMLRELEKIDLNEGKILANVDKVIGVCKAIISQIFQKDSENNERSGRGILGGLMEMIYPPILPVLDAIFALAYLAIMVIAILCIWGIAKLLQVIEDLDINQGKIQNNVEKVLSTCRFIINRIFVKDEEDQEKSSRGILGAFIKLFYPPLSPVLDAVFALVYLALMIIAIVIILGIAKLLQVIQDIDINQDKMLDNVNIVLQTCRHIIKMIFAPDEENEDRSNRSGISAFLAWVMPELGPILDAIFALAYLAVMMIAMTVVLGMVKLLEQIGMIDQAVLEQAQVNADLTMKTAQYIASIVYREDDQNQDKSSRGSIVGFISWVMPELGSIMGAILTVAYLALMTIAMVIVLGIVKIMAEVGKIDTSVVENAATIVEIVMTTGYNIVNKVYEGEDNGSKESNRGGLLKVVEWIAGKDVADVIAALLSVAHLALMAFAIYIVAAIAKSMNEIGGLDRDKILKARDNASLVMETAVHIMDLLMNGDFELPEATDDENMPALLRWLLPDSLKSIVGAIMTIGALALSEIMIGALGEIAKSLKYIASTDTSYISKANENANLIMDASGNILKRMNTDIIGTFGSVEEFKKVAEVIKSMSSLIVSVANIGVALQKLAELPEFDLPKATENTIKMYQATMAIIEVIAQTATDKSDQMKELLDSLVPGADFFGGMDWLCFSAYDVFAERLKKLAEIVKGASGAVKNMVTFLKEIPNLHKQMTTISGLDSAAMAQFGSMFYTLWRRLNSAFVDIHNIMNDAGEKWLSDSNLEDDTEQLGLMTSVAKAATGVLRQLSWLFRSVQNVANWVKVLSSVEFDAEGFTAVVALFRKVNVMLKCILATGMGASWQTLKETAETASVTIYKIQDYMVGCVNLIPVIQALATSLANISVDLDKVSDNSSRMSTALMHMRRIIALASFPAKRELVHQNMDLMDRINQSIQGFVHVTSQDVKNSKQLTDNYIAFLTRVNTMDFTKLKTTEQLMKHWADMSRSINGNFQGLAQALNEHIMPALQKLDKTMDESVKVQKQIIEDLAKPIDASQLTSGMGGATSMPGSVVGSPTDTSMSAGSTGGGAGNNGANTGARTNNTSAASTTGASGGGDGLVGDYQEDDMYLDKETNTYKHKNKENGSFLSPYGAAPAPKKQSAIDRLSKALDGDAIRVKIVN